MLDRKLMEHIDGQRELSQTQLAAAMGLLKKVLPDLTENKVEHAGNLTVEVLRFTDANQAARK